MPFNSFQRLSFLLILLAITVPALSFDWQGTGNMTQDNMTVIHTTITNNPPGNADVTAVENSAMAISVHLNNLWAPAWNVIIVYPDTAKDSIVYGYAFNGHWLWLNGVSNSQISYIIWKDYNCHTWSKLADLPSTTFTSGQISAIRSFTFTRILTDLWADAHDFVEYLNTHAQLSSGAYTAILSQASVPVFNGYICLFNSNYYLAPYIQGQMGSGDGAYYVFQTRQK